MGRGRSKEHYGNMMFGGRGIYCVWWRCVGIDVGRRRVAFVVFFWGMWDVVLDLWWLGKSFFPFDPFFQKRVSFLRRTDCAICAFRLCPPVSITLLVVPPACLFAHFFPCFHSKNAFFFLSTSNIVGGVRRGVVLGETTGLGLISKKFKRVECPPRVSCSSPLSHSL
jgi:hypothetical protein